LLLSRARWLSAAHGAAPADRRFAVVVEAGAQCTSVHTFHFGAVPLRRRSAEPLVLLNHAVELQKPGLWSLADDVAGAAASLLEPLRTAEAGVPLPLRAGAPLSFRVTAELALMLGAERTAALCEAVRGLLLESFPQFPPPSSVAPLPGARRAQLTWLAVNFLARTLHSGAPHATTGVVDVDAADAQRAHALDAPPPPPADRPDVMRVAGTGAAYTLYGHSHVGYGGGGARSRVLHPLSSGAPPRLPRGAGGAHPCLADRVSLQFANMTWEGMSAAGGASEERCSAAARRLLHRSPCPPATDAECAFGGVWGGGHGAGTRRMAATGLTFELAQAAGLVPAGALSARVKPAAFRAAASVACGLTGGELRKQFKRAPAAGTPEGSLFCWDLSYMHALLVDGLGLDAQTPLLLIKRVMYRQRLVDAGWALGEALAMLEADPR
jgi:apyrase